MKEFIVKHKQYLLSGVSFVIPFIACGGILIATTIAFAPMGATGPDISNSLVLKLINDIGSASFALMLPVLAGYISYAIAGKPGMVSGFIGGYLSGQINAGFLGALLAGVLAGHLVNLIKKLPTPKVIKPIMPILIIPIFSSLVIGTLMLKVIGIPIANFMVFLGEWLQGLGAGNAIVLAILLGAMIAFDMGGPVNKAAFFFGAAMIKQGNCFVMGSVAAAICTPPLGMGLATLLGGKIWDEQEKEAGIAAIGMGLMGITEGAIPFAATDPIRVIPCIMIGSITAAVIAMLGKAQDHAPHGGPIVLPVVDNRVIYVIAILCGMIVTAIAINAVKKFTLSKKGA
jgi:fructose PTS system EIIBC or EIIC component